MRPRSKELRRRSSSALASAGGERLGDPGEDVEDIGNLQFVNQKRSERIRMTRGQNQHPSDGKCSQLGNNDYEQEATVESKEELVHRRKTAYERHFAKASEGQVVAAQIKRPGKDGAIWICSPDRDQI
ncbi:hypothetical protein PR003_g6996 [Phytophthora rubi]|uniref:Uncharacterized protein n=1 Tax=Phytophthora rubi TaxID=129364 RepID=A0A6A4FL29_9STRA|nr:hypothetical protein PR003_g6996 [Phytophthora rubi]